MVKGEGAGGRCSWRERVVEGEGGGVGWGGVGGKQHQAAAAWAA